MGHVVLGDGTWVSEPVADGMEQVAALEGELLRFLSDPPATEPEPCPACSRCRWAPECRTAWRDRGHLILLKLDDRTRRKFVAAGTTTVEEVAALPVGAEVEGVAPEMVRLARSDARLLLHQRASGSPYLRLRYPREGKGLFLLPPPVPGDVFLDLEGYPHGPEGQREYLFGLAVEHGGGPAYRARWAHGAAEEEAAFAEVVEFLADWIAADPARRVYHYHSYEPAAFRRLGARCGGWVAAAAIELLQTAFVDLLPIVRYSVRTSSLSSGLKALEPFYRSRRAGEVTSGAGSMVAYRRWLGCHDPTLLDGIEAYNRDDCESLAELRDWLLDLAASVAGSRSTTAGSARAEAVAEVAAVTDPMERLAVARSAGDGPLLRRTLVDLEWRGDLTPLGMATLLGWNVDQMEEALVHGKQELGVPVSADALRRQRPRRRARDRS